MNVKYLITCAFLALLTACSSETSEWENFKDEGTFFVYRRQSQKAF